MIITKVKKTGYLICAVAMLMAGCEAKHVRPIQPDARFARKQLTRMGYTIQVGAFSNVENAARMVELLREKGLEATYFVAHTGLYKVRFGDFPSKGLARERAEKLKLDGMIDEYYIVSPDEYSISRKQTHGELYVREHLVKTAKSFIGVPYLWAGTSPESGFDCSGFTMTVYQLNGLNLPRSSLEQFDAGVPVGRNGLSKGDLVFFSTTGGNKVSHVGIYLGDGTFVHAPGKGKRIRVDSMAEKYYSKRFVGARSYL